MDGIGCRPSVFQRTICRSSGQIQLKQIAAQAGIAIVRCDVGRHQHDHVAGGFTASGGFSGAFEVERVDLWLLLGVEGACLRQQCLNHQIATDRDDAIGIVPLNGGGGGFVRLGRGRRILRAGSVLCRGCVLRCSGG